MKFDCQLSVCYSYVMGCLLANINETVVGFVGSSIAGVQSDSQPGSRGGGEFNSLLDERFPE